MQGMAFITDKQHASARWGTTLWGSEQSFTQANANASSLVGCVRVSYHYSHTSYISDKILFLMSVPSNTYGRTVALLL